MNSLTRLFNNLSVSRKVILSNGILILIIVSAFLFLHIKVNQNNNIITEQGKLLNQLELIQSFSNHFNRTHYYTLEHVINLQSDSIQNIQQKRQALDTELNQLLSTNVIKQNDYDKLNNQLNHYFQLNSEAIKAYQQDNRQQNNMYLGEKSKLSNDINASLQELISQIRNKTSIAGNSVQSANKTLIWLSDALLLLIIVVGVLFSYSLARAIKRPLQYAVDVTEDIAQGNWEKTIEVDSKDETGKLLLSIKKMRDHLKENIENDMKAQANAALSVKIALDNAAANIMVCDNDNKLIYCNNNLKALFNKIGSQYIPFLKEINSDCLNEVHVSQLKVNLDGKDIDIKNFELNKNQQVLIGNFILRLTAKPVVSPEGEKLGIVFEWNDRTEENAIENEIDNIVDAAAAGNMEQRLSTEDKYGFYKRLSKGINKMLEVNKSSLTEVVKLLEGLAQGNLLQQVNGEYDGLFLRLQQAANNTTNNLTEIIFKIRMSSESVRGASKELSANNIDLSQRTEEQAASLTEISSRMEEVSETVKESANQAKQADELSSKAHQLAVNGGNLSEQVIDAVKAINDSSNQIAEIIGVIDEIAFQTNLLALNAAVEAARAGEQGRGFAVVASEVRELAQRSAEAAKEIKDLIHDSVRKANRGSELVTESGTALTEIVSTVKTVSENINNMARGAEMQATKITDMQHSIAQMDSMTQQNAALVEQSAASSESMAKQANDMMNQVTFFKTNEYAQENTNLNEVYSPNMIEHEQLTGTDNTAISSSTELATDTNDKEWEEF